MKNLTPYQIEYRKYLNTYNNCPSIMPCFIEYLRDQRDDAGQHKNWKEYARFENLIIEDIEENDHGYYYAEDSRSDADPGL